MLYNPVEVTVADKQREKLNKQIQRNYLSVKIVVKGIAPPTHTLLLTRGQIAKIEKAREIGRRKFKTIRMSRKQIAKNRLYQGRGSDFLGDDLKDDFLGDDLKDDPEAQHVNTKQPLHTVESEKNDDGVYFVRNEHTMKVLPVKDNGLYLQPHPLTLHGVVADGLYLKRGNVIENAEKIIFDVNSPFQNFSILQCIL